MEKFLVNDISSEKDLSVKADLKNGSGLMISYTAETLSRQVHA